MAVQKKIGHGITISQNGTAMSQIRNIRWITQSREEVEATTLDDGVEYMLPSDPENVGEVTFEQIWTGGEANHELIETDFDARTINAYTVVFNTWTTTRTAAFNAWVKSHGDVQIDGKTVLFRTVVLKLTSKPSWS
jgi:hypothetical protein